MTATSSSSQRSGVIAPYGGTLVDLMVSAPEHAALKASATTSIECSDRNACDVELLVVGGFSPERGFMHQADYDSVVAGHRTTSGYLFGLPIVMDTDREDVAARKEAKRGERHGGARAGAVELGEGGVLGDAGRHVHRRRAHQLRRAVKHRRALRRGIEKPLARTVDEIRARVGGSVDAGDHPIGRRGE